MMRSLLSLSLLLWLSGIPFGPSQAESKAIAPSAANDIEWFRATEQRLMDAIAVGDKTPWNDVMDESCIVTTEEGTILSKEALLKELRGLPPGLSGTIQVKDLTVQKVGDFAVVRFRLEEQENVFGQQLSTQYRVTDMFRRAGEKWKMVASHASVVTMDPPAQPASKKTWPWYAGKYKLLPDGWTFHVVLRDGVLHGGRDIANVRPFIPLAPNVFTLQGSLGEWIFVSENGSPASRIVHFRKFEPLIWTRVAHRE
jgi:ketosteroid isomerase-like protein